jgi:sigma-B regulation protein RsbU (phosphoserine phosphatase)
MLAIQYTKRQLDVRYQRSLSLTNDIQQVPKLAEFMDNVCEAMGFDSATTMKMNLAIEEAVVNVMNYAYPEGTTGAVNIEVQANDVRLKFVISDSGKYFDPTNVATADTTLSAEERSIGGLGIYLVRQLMDSVNYERIGGFNVLTLRKKLNQ